MSGGYLTLDLRGLKDFQDKIVKKGIFNYIHDTKKPIRVILPEWFINYVTSNVTETKFIGSIYDIELSLIDSGNDYGYSQYDLCLPVFASYVYNETLADSYRNLNKYFVKISKKDELSVGEF